MKYRVEVKRWNCTAQKFEIDPHDFSHEAEALAFHVEANGGHGADCGVSRMFRIEDVTPAAKQTKGGALEMNYGEWLNNGGSGPFDHEMYCDETGAQVPIGPCDYWSKLFHVVSYDVKAPSVLPPLCNEVCSVRVDVFRYDDGEYTGSMTRFAWHSREGDVCPLTPEHYSPKGKTLKPATNLPRQMSECSEEDKKTLEAAKLVSEAIHEAICNFEDGTTMVSGGIDPARVLKLSEQTAEALGVGE